MAWITHKRLERLHRVAVKRTDRASEKCLKASLKGAKGGMRKALNRWADAAGTRDRLAAEIAARKQVYDGMTAFYARGGR